MDRDTADAEILFNNENILAEFGRLDGRPFSRRTAADDDEIIETRHVFR